jgi:hypothetical protein
LILQCDSEKLLRDGLSIAAGGASAAQLVQSFSDIHVDVVEGTDERSLAREFAHRSGAAFDVIVVIGHANEAGLQLASDRFAPWSVVAEWLRPFAPRRLVLLACRAGRALPAQILFDELRQLRRVYASPMAVTKATAQLLLAAVPYLVLNRVPNSTLFRGAQLTVAALTGGHLREWTRVEDHRNPTSPLWDVVADVVDPVVRDLNRRVVGGRS